LERELAELGTANLSAINSGGDRVVSALGKAISRSNRQLYRQFEALTNLNTMMPFDRPMPPTRGYPASPDLLLLLVDLVRQHRPSLVVECGSGTSTVWIARAIRHFGIDWRVVALEHERQYAKQTRQYIDDDELSDHADVRDAPLEMFDIAGTQWQWYASSAWKDLDNIDFVFVDGPPGSIADQARFPALPLLFEHLATDVVVVVDDLVREDERKIMAEWLATYSGFTSERVQLETGGAILRRGDQ
jgi:predicted O-methyltransferase YrrM